MDEVASAVHRTIIVVDVEGYGRHRRTTPDRVALRAGLYAALRQSFIDAGVSWEELRLDDCGDGVFVLVPAEIRKSVLVERFPLALASAVCAHNESHEESARIRLRMALHAGEITYDEHGVTAPAINRAFRLLSAPPLKAALADSAGVLALITSAWFFDEVVRHSTVVNPATFRAVHVEVKETSELAWIALPDQPYPAVRLEDSTQQAEPSGRRRSTLPRDVSEFTGRAGEFAELTEVAACERTSVAVQVLDGMPGVGKTAFAVHAAHRLAGGFPDGQIFLELHGHTQGREPLDTEDALASLLLAWGVPARRIPRGVDDRARMWREQLSGKRVLLVLDDAVGSGQLRPLLPAEPGCLVLITSRRRLAWLDGSRSLSLGTLMAPDAADMFRRCVGADRGEPASVAELMELCGYLPLAIALTAGRLRSHPSWTVQQLVDDLARARDRVRWIRADDRTVASAFDLSYRDLDVDEQRLFRRLSLHPSTQVDGYAAAALDGGDFEQACDRLEKLYLNHLVDEPAPGRYRMHDLTRAYSSSLDEGPDEADAAVDRLLTYYLWTVQKAVQFLQSRTPRPDATPVEPQDSPVFRSENEAKAWLSAERGSIKACVVHAATRGRSRRAWELAAAVHPYLGQYGHWHDALRIHEAAVAAAQRERDVLAEATSLVDLGAVHALIGQYSAAEGCLVQARELYTSQGDRFGEARTCAELGRVLTTMARFSDAIECLARAGKLYDDLAVPLGTANALVALANLHFTQDEYLESDKKARRALSICIAIDNRRGELQSRILIGNVQSGLGNPAGAMVIYNQILDAVGGADDLFTEAVLFNNLGRMHYDLGEFEVAADWLERANARFSELGHWTTGGVTLTNLGRVATARGDYAVALNFLNRARERFDTDQARQAENLNNFGQLALEWPDAGNPRDHFHRALALARSIGVRLQEARALAGLGLYRLAEDDVAGGTSYLHQALDVYKAIGAPGAATVTSILAAVRDGTPIHVGVL